MLLVAVVPCTNEIDNALLANVGRGELARPFDVVVGKHKCFHVSLLLTCTGFILLRHLSTSYLSTHNVCNCRRRYQGTVYSGNWQER